MKKFKALAWVALYMVAALGVQVLAMFSLIGVIYMAAVRNGIGIQTEAFQNLYEQMAGSISKGMGAMVLTAFCDIMMLAGFGLWYYFRENKYEFRPDYKKAFTRGNVGAIAGIALFGQFSVELVLVVINALFPWMMDQYSEVNDLLQLDTMSPVLMILIVCLIGPVAEEMVFRGMIYAKLRRAFSVWPAAIISALLFGLFHANWVQGIYATLVGIILAYVYEKTQTIWGSCLLHILFNSSSYLLDWLMKMVDSQESAVIGVIRLAVDVASVFITIIFVRHFRSKNKRIEE